MGSSISDEEVYEIASNVLTITLGLPTNSWLPVAGRGTGSKRPGRVCEPHRRVVWLGAPPMPGGARTSDGGARIPDRAGRCAGGGHAGHTGGTCQYGRRKPQSSAACALPPVTPGGDDWVGF